MVHPSPPPPQIFKNKKIIKIKIKIKILTFTTEEFPNTYSSYVGMIDIAILSVKL